MPGKRIPDHQVQKFKQHRKTLSQASAAAKVAISERSARRIEQLTAIGFIALAEATTPLANPTGPALSSGLSRKCWVNT